MKQELLVTRLDIKAFAEAGGELARQDLLSKYERLMAETKGLGANSLVDWSARGERREIPGAVEQLWLHLTARTRLPLTCQRCLGPVETPMAFSRSYRFVADEAVAEVQDEEAEEDVLALSQEFNLQDLIEDEFLMELPVVPRHELCPTEVQMQVADPDFEAPVAEKVNPFAVLAGLKGKKSG